MKRQKAPGSDVPGADRFKLEDKQEDVESVRDVGFDLHVGAAGGTTGLETDGRPAPLLGMLDHADLSLLGDHRTPVAVGGEREVEDPDAGPDHVADLQREDLERRRRTTFLGRLVPFLEVRNLSIILQGHLHVTLLLRGVCLISA